LNFLTFCRQINFPLSAGQAALAAVAFDGLAIGDLPADLAAPALELFGGAIDVPTSARSTIAIVAGRGGGKSRLAGAYLLWRSLFAPLSLGAGELGYAITIAPDRALAGISLDFARGVLESSKFARAIESETAESLVLKRPDGVRVAIEVFSASAGGKAVRGKTIVAAVLDESAFFYDSSKAVNAADIFRAIVPRLVRGGAVVLASTPWLRNGLLWELFDANFGKPRTALVAHAPTLALRGDDPDVVAMVAREAERDPDNARRELGAEWLALGAGNLFDPASLEASLVDAADRLPSGMVSIGGDIGLVNDPTGFVAVQRTPAGMLNVLDVVELRPKRGKPIELEQVVRHAAQLCDSYRVRKVRVDHHSLTQAREWATKLRLHVTFEPASEGAARQLRFQRLADAVKVGKLAIPRTFAALTEQLGSLIATPKTQGGFSFEAPRRSGHHADAAMATILACEPLLAFSSHLDGLRRLAENRQRAANRLCMLNGNTPIKVEQDRSSMFCRTCGYNPAMCRCER